MKAVDLIEQCKSAIAENRCMGCQALELPYFKGDKNCKLYDKKGEQTKNES